MINVKIENASRENHHTVRLTPANGDRVDPTTLKGAAIWDDELSLCLAPITRDLSCLGTDEVAIFTTVPETFGDWEFRINDVDMGIVANSINDSESPLKIEMTEVEDGFLTRLENRTSECIRIDFNYNGDVQPDTPLANMSMTFIDIDKEYSSRPSENVIVMDDGSINVWLRSSGPSGPKEVLN